MKEVAQSRMNFDGRVELSSSSLVFNLPTDSTPLKFDFDPWQMIWDFTIIWQFQPILIFASK